MEKSMSRAKHAASRRGRRRFSSHARRCHHGPAPCSGPSVRGRSGSEATESDIWDGYQEVLPLEEIDEEGGVRSKGLDYGELLAQDPFYGYTALPPRGSDVLDDAIADIYSYRGSEDSNVAEFLSVDLEKLSDRLAGVSLAKRLFLEDETLPSELFVGDEVSVEDHGSGSEKVVVPDPEDTKLVKISDDGAEAPEGRGSEVRVTEEELDSLLNLLDKVSFEMNNNSSASCSSSSSNISTRIEKTMTMIEPEPEPEMGTRGDERNSASFMSREELDVLFWSPNSSEAEKATEKPSAAAPPAADDDFDAWLDSLE